MDVSAVVAGLQEAAIPLASIGGGVLLVLWSAKAIKYVSRSLRIDE